MQSVGLSHRLHVTAGKASVSIIYILQWWSATAKFIATTASELCEIQNIPITQLCIGLFNVKQQIPVLMIVEFANSLREIETLNWKLLLMFPAIIRNICRDKAVAIIPIVYESADMVHMLKLSHSHPEVCPKTSMALTPAPSSKTLQVSLLSICTLFSRTSACRSSLLNFFVV